MAARLLARKRAGVFDAYPRRHWESALAARFAVHAAGDAARRHPHAVPLHPSAEGVLLFINPDERCQRVRPFRRGPRVWTGFTPRGYGVRTGDPMDGDRTLLEAGA